MRLFSLKITSNVILLFFFDISLLKYFGSLNEMCVLEGSLFRLCTQKKNAVTWQGFRQTSDWSLMNETRSCAVRGRRLTELQKVSAVWRLHIAHLPDRKRRIYRCCRPVRLCCRQGPYLQHMYSPSSLEWEKNSQLNICVQKWHKSDICPCHLSKREFP